MKTNSFQAQLIGRNPIFVYLMRFILKKYYLQTVFNKTRIWRLFSM